ncbi:MAG: V-type ATPase subunit [DPANN group archaeon]|nr:V-type ATPase subunit [DPANN group archaeon]
MVLVKMKKDKTITIDKLKLHRDPYLNTRVRVMSSKLISKDQYHRLLKMTSAEISHFLEEGEYKAQIDEFAVRYAGADLIEVALNNNASKCFQKVIHLSKGDTKELIQKYMLRIDIENIKTILRCLNSEIPKDEISLRLMSGCNVNKKNLLDLLKKKTISDIVEDPMFQNILPHATSSIPKPKGDDLTLASVENWLDINYYRYLMCIADKLPKHASEFKTFLRNEIDILNINTLLIMKNEGLEKKDIMQLLITPAADISLPVLESAASAKDIEGALDILINKTSYSVEIKSGIDEALKGSLKVIRRGLDKKLMKKAFLLLHKHPLTIAPVLGYILAKEVEIRNLKLISRSKSLNLPEKFIEENLII